jgi:hypothetical protein
MHKLTAFSILLTLSALLDIPTLSAQDDDESFGADAIKESSEDEAEPSVQPHEGTLETARPVEEQRLKEEMLDDGVFGPWRLGASAALGIPHPVTYGLDATWNRTVAVALSFGSFTAETGGVTLKISNWDIRARWFPWRSSFFLGVACGAQTLGVVAENEIEGEPYKVTIDVKTSYLTPHFGWLARWRSGFMLGFEVGYQMPLANASTVSVDSNLDEEALAEDKEFQSSLDDAEDAADEFGEKALPYVTLLRLGYSL